MASRIIATLTKTLVTQFYHYIFPHFTFFVVTLQTNKTDTVSSRPNGWGVKTKGEKFVGPNIMGQLLMSLRDNGKLKYSLPSDALAFIELLK